MSINKTKEILYVSRPISPPWDEASKNFAYNLAKEISLDSEVLKIHLLTSQTLPELPQNIVQEKIYKFSQKDYKNSDKLRALIFQYREKKNFDIKHYFFTPTPQSSQLIKNFLKGNSKTVQTIATIREDLFNDQQIEEMMFGDIIVTYSEYAKEKLENMGFKNVYKIYPGIDLNDYYPREKSELELKKANFTPNDFIINFSGEYIRLGAMDTIIESFIEISQRIRSARLSLAVRVKNKQDAEKKEAIIARLKEEKILDRVSFHDDGSYKMSDIYNLSDISIFPVSDMKGKFDVPLAVIEAMACGKAMIISDIPILEEFSKDNSISIEKDSPQALTEAIIDLYSDEKKRMEIAKNALQFAHRNFNIHTAAQKYVSLYNKL